MLNRAVFSDRGTREVNEDSFITGVSGDAHVFVVADGLGGHGGGEVASQIAVNAICDTFIEKGYSRGFFREAFNKAQQNILDEQNRQYTLCQMKTTVVTLVFFDNKFYMAHTGDSRIYCFKNGKIVSRTIDHSVPQMLALAGDISESDIRNHPDRNCVLHVLGVSGEKPYVEEDKPVKLSGTMDFLLCTDGYWELIDESQMIETLRESESPEEWIEKMNVIIRKNGEGKEMDNFTAIAVHAKKQGLFGK